MDLLTPQLISGLRTVFSLFATPVSVLNNNSTSSNSNASNKGDTLVDDDKKRDDTLVLGLSQLSSVMQALGLEATETEVYETLTQCDRLGRGYLDFPEFVLLMCSEMKDTVLDADLADAFAAIDRDGDKNGTLQAPEIEAEILAVKPQGTGAVRDVSLTRSDINGIIFEISGPNATGVTLPEFSKMMKASL
jgi:Ca2+-binding EF-hand superfamily protein